MSTIKMNNKGMYDLLIVWIGSTSTWVLTVMDLVINIFVGVGTLIFTAVKLLEWYRKFKSEYKIVEKEENDQLKKKS